MSEVEKVGKRIWKKVTTGQTPHEESKQIDNLFQQWSVGFSQDLQGQGANQFVEDFLDWFSEETRNDIEESVKAVHDLKDFNRFRRKMISMFAVIYANGVVDGKEGSEFDLMKLREEAIRKVHEQHKDVLKPIPEKM